jgi:hypothetical protein
VTIFRRNKIRKLTLYFSRPTSSIATKHQTKKSVCLRELALPPLKRHVRPVAEGQALGTPGTGAGPIAFQNGVRFRRLISSALGARPYVVFDGTLDDCIRQFMSKPASQHHLYEIHTEPQQPLISAVLSAEHIVELARLRDFL